MYGKYIENSRGRYRPNQYTQQRPALLLHPTQGQFGPYQQQINIVPVPAQFVHGNIGYGGVRRQWENTANYNFPQHNTNFQQSNALVSHGTPIGKRPHAVQTGKKRIFDDDEEPRYKKLKSSMPPSHKDDMNSQITAGIWRYFENNRQTEKQYQNKVELRDALYVILKEIFPYCGLYMVGSSMSGFATKTSDMDLCLMVTQEQIEGKKEAVEILMMIQTALRRSRFVRKSQLIRARVPILKFEDYKNGIECDLNINNPVGIRNTHLLRYYASMDWRIRPLVLFMKKWARFHDINDASKKTISSYSLCLMMLHYLQAGCNPPVLDSVQKLYPDLFDYGSDIRNLKMNIKIQFKSKNSDSVGTLFLGFLQYYTKEFCFSTDVASIRQGTRLPVHLVQSWTPASEISMWRCLKVEEPFDRSNTARSCYDEATFARVMRVIARSHRQLSIKRDIESVLSVPF